jgi:hypothetical protein
MTPSIEERNMKKVAISRIRPGADPTPSFAGRVLARNERCQDPPCATIRRSPRRRSRGASRLRSPLRSPGRSLIATRCVRLVLRSNGWWNRSWPQANTADRQRGWEPRNRSPRYLAPQRARASPPRHLGCFNASTSSSRPTEDACAASGARTPEQEDRAPSLRCAAEGGEGSDDRRRG